MFATKSQTLCQPFIMTICHKKLINFSYNYHKSGLICRNLFRTDIYEPT